MKNKIMIMTIGLIVTGVLYVYVSGNKFQDRVREEIRHVLRAGDSGRKAFLVEDVKSLPAPVRKYIQYALKDGQPVVGKARIAMSGTFKLKESDQWIPFEATQYLATTTPSYLWHAKLRPLPYLWTEARDLFFKGRGSSVNRLLSAMPISFDAGREADLSAMARYLTESPWFPTALLPSENLEWNAVDSMSAKAFFRYNGYTVSAIFTMNERGEIVKAVTNDRFRTVKGNREQTPWTAHYRNYQEVQGMMIPREIEAQWNFKDRAFVYARSSVTDIAYNED
jgi:hypothetical protein